MVPKTCRHREHKMLYCWRNQDALYVSGFEYSCYSLFFHHVPWIWNYILSLLVWLRHESCLFFESLIWSLCNERHGTWILPWCPHSSDHVYARSYQSVPLSMYIWLSLDGPHSSSYFFTIRYHALFLKISFFEILFLPYSSLCTAWR